jgi:lysophospholipase L1-like esterase
MLGRLLVLAIGGVVLAAPALGAKQAGAAFLGRAESWDYAPAMRAVAKHFTGPQGVVLHLGDSITYASPYTAWARGGEGKTAADTAVLRWSHCGEETDRDGWYLAHVDRPEGRSETAAGGIRSDQYLAGGFHGLPSLDEIIAKYHPQVTLLMLGSNDLAAKRPVADYARDMESIVTRLLEHGTVVILSTIPPAYFDLDGTAQYNAALWKLAKQHRLPMIDFYGEILARRPGGTWNGTLLSKDDVHPTADRAGVTGASTPTPEHLRESGYLLRGWLAVRKLEQVKGRVLGGRAK